MSNKIRYWIRIILFALICVLLSACLNWLTMPPNVVWMNLHNVKKMENIDYLFIGTSHGQYGISPEIIDSVMGEKSFNLCMADEYPIDSYYLMKEVCRKHKPRKIIYELDPSYWIQDQRQGSTAMFFYKEFPLSLNKAEYFLTKIMKQDFRSTLFPWSYYKNNLVKIKDTIEKKSSVMYRNYDPSILEISGGIYKKGGFLYQNKVEGADKGTFNNIPWDETQIRESAVKAFEKIVMYCHKENIELEVITLPVPEDTVSNMPENFMQADRFFAEMMKKHKISYHNFNFDKDLHFDRSMNSYWDYDGHMYGEDAEDFSRELGKYLLSRKKEN